MGLKRGFVFLFSIVILFSILGFVYAQEDLSTIDENAELEQSAGTTPDSAFYFIDKFFDNFADEVKVRQEKVAEIREMIEEENFEAALEALEEYRKFADELEREVSPGQREGVRRSAAAIYNVLKSLEAQIPDEYREDLFEDIIEREQRIVIAVEIAEKIKLLCEELSELDPVAYERTCRTSDEDPRWHRDLDKDLTEEQRKEAEAFFEIMIQCFETNGEECRCEDISIKPFADKCSQIAPLAYACDVENDEAACDKMDEIEAEEPIEDLLPDYLRDVLRNIERRFDEERFEHYGGPRECEGINDKAECEEKLFRLHAPPACVRELLDNSGITFDRNYGTGEAQRDCEEIMFGLEAPQECLDAGLTDFRECGILMFQLNAPQECLDAGLTGEYRGDERACRELVGGDFGDRGGSGPNINYNCAGISDAGKRLECYDIASSQVDSFHGGFDDPNYNGPCLTQNDWSDKEDQCRNLYGQHSGLEEIYGSSGEGFDCVIDLECIDYGDYDKGDDVPPYDCSLLDCQQGFYCDPYDGCVFDGSTTTLQCPGDFQCGTGEICNSNGECIVDPNLSTLQCPGDFQCGTGEICDGGNCIVDPNPVAAGNVILGNVISDNDFIEYYYR